MVGVGMPPGRRWIPFDHVVEAGVAAGAALGEADADVDAFDAGPRKLTGSFARWDDGRGIGQRLSGRVGCSARRCGLTASGLV
jgi:hypothetical protein